VAVSASQQTEVVSLPPEAVGSGENAAPPSSWAVAPYIDLTANNALALMRQAMLQGTRFFNLAFVQSDSSGNASWGGYYPATSGTFATQLLSVINQDRQMGGDVAVSFGGWNACQQGLELGQFIKNAAQLQTQYQDVIHFYGLRRIDFDLEGIAVTNTASVTLRNQVIASLQQGADPGLQVVYTLHANPEGPHATPGGLPADQLGLLRNAIQQGVQVTEVNAMTMDYGPWWVNGRSLGACSIDAAEQVNLQLQGLFGKTAAQAWAMEGITEHIGANAAGSGTFTPADAQTVLQFIRQTHPATISFWSVNKDATANWQYTRIFQE
jgi:hypothetical protein